MNPPTQPTAAALLSLVITISASALELRSYDSELHDRFVNFPESPSFNPNFFYDARKLTGIGWDAEGSDRQYALISRCHVLFANHHAPAIGSRIRFLSSSGSIVERSVSGKTVVSNASGSSSDLSLLTLSSPIDASDGVSPLPYLNLPDEESYLDQPLLVFGTKAKAGEGRLTGFRTINVNWFISRTFNFDYDLAAEGSSDARLAGGDSGSPSLTDVEGRPALIGVHLASSSSDDMQTNYDACIPHYIGQIDPLLAGAGFRMRPVNTLATKLDCRISGSPPAARQGHPLEMDFEITNEGESITGNLEVEIRFPQGAAPDSLSGDGWVITDQGDHWTARLATLDPSSSTTIQANWSQAPLESSIDPEIRWDSDSSPEESSTFTLSLNPSYPSWAAGLSDPDPAGDPDHDGLENLLEYAFGSSPTSGSAGEMPRPRLSISGNQAIFQFAEREDKAARGLVYSPQWSDRLFSGSWSASPPSGWSSTSSPYSPPIPGFIERTISWPLGETNRFVRLEVSIDE